MLDILNTTQKTFPLSKKRLIEIKDYILGKNYELSIAVVGDKKIQTLNKQFRNKDYPTDVLSFPLSKISGEIFINLKVATKKSSEFQMSAKNYFTYALIHSMLHLKGFEHGKEMEKEEEKLKRHFHIS
jgi:probable rRNA maturation factor